VAERKRKGFGYGAWLPSGGRLKDRQQHLQKQLHKQILRLRRRMTTKRQPQWQQQQGNCNDRVRNHVVGGYLPA
jgi:hypothetical protein